MVRVKKIARRTLSAHEVGTGIANPRLQYVKEKWC